MLLTLMKSKLHMARVTDANLNYRGSITIDENLMDLVGFVKNERVQVVNNNNGKRFYTYVIPGERARGDICLNGAAARLVQPGDVIIVISYALFDQKEAEEHKPKVVFLNEKNEVVEVVRE